MIVSAAVVLCLLSPNVGEAANEGTEGTTYYFSSTDGDDTNDGLSPEKPFKSLKKAEELSLKAGDSLLLKRGDIWYGSVTLELDNGSKENPIVISAYGDESEERPSLRYYTGRVITGVTENVLIIRNANGVEISDIMVGYGNSGIRFEYDTLGNEYLRITNCHFHDIYGITQKDALLDKMAFSSGMYWAYVGDDSYDGTEKFTVSEVYVDRCTSYDGGSLTGYTSGVRNLYMTECVAEYNGYYGTVITCTGGYIDRCVFDNNGTRSMPVGSTGIMISAKDFTVKNSIISNQQRQGNDPDGCGIDFEWQNKNVTIDNCLFEGNAGVGLMFFTSGQSGALGENAGTNYDCVVKNCKFVNDNTNIGNMGGYEIYAVEAGCGNCVVKDNEYVIDDTTATETVSFDLIVGDNDCTLENNKLVDAIADDYDPLLVNDEKGTDGADVTGGAEKGSQMPSYLHYLIGVAEGVVVVALVLAVLFVLKRKRGVANEED